ncbi:MAG: aminotransferase class I/II-fold pyridoxal phosphate-dependent enzyme [Actinomycetota bacterium]|nr:aminotransferase class I/II-fold pyridoxal phosphate-dependent enzyme [Actinomycetota bacterium]
MNIINPLAVELNETLRDKAPSLYRSLSVLGKELYFPRGILSQTAEAKRSADRYNATIGIATSGEEPLHLPFLRKQLPYMEPSETFPYAPATGLPELRRLWKEHQLEVNPGLAGKGFSLPVVTSGLTHGLSICADLFCDAGNTLLLPDKIWGNYRLIFETRRGANIAQYPLFKPEGGMDTASFRLSLIGLDQGSKVLVLLNFPNNPTGYTPTVREAEELHAALLDAADGGTDIVAILDDAYFGLFYEEGISEESLFSRLADAHPNITAVKLDGPTKEDYVWGFRIGFITFSTGGGEDRSEVFEALEKKVGGLIRGTISNCSMLAQSLLIKTMKASGYREEKEEKHRVMKDRYDEVREVLSDPRYGDAFEPYPFNSGYFMCLRLKKADAEQLRRKLLEKYGVGVISLGDSDLRIAFSCLDREQVKDLFDILYIAASEINR